MSPDFDQKLQQIYEEALELPQAKRKRFLDFACADSAELRQAVVRLLEARGELEETGAPAGEAIGSTAGRARLEKISRYMIRGELGKGAMGAVYEAMDPMIGRTVALKVLLSHMGDEEEAKALEDRLFREASSAGRLAHPGIVTVFDVGKEGEMAFIAMERVEGPTLQEMMKDRKIERQQVLEILRQAAAAMDYAHGEGIIHRDIKPANIMLHKGAQAKIADFGIAKVSTMSQLTMAGTILGTPSYMSPEQIQNLKLEGTSDQFSLAVVAYEMLTGAKPFERETMPALMLAIVNGERPSASKADPTLPAIVDEVFQMSLHRLPEKRFGSCTAFVNALAGSLGIEFSAYSGAGSGIHAVLQPASSVTGPRAALPPLPPPPPPASLGATVVNHPAPPPPPPPGRTAPTVKASRSGVYIAGGFAVVALAAAYPIYRSLNPKPEPAKKDKSVAVPNLSAGNDAVKKEEVAVPPPTEPKAEGESKEPIKATPEKEPGKVAEDRATAPKAEPKADLARAQQIYEEGVAKHKGQPGSAAIPSFEEAAGMGEPRAMLELGKIYSAGDGVAKDPAKAASWYRKSADLGNASAMVFLGALYAQGSGVPKDMAEAAKWVRKAAEAGNAVAMDGLGQMYANGQGLPVDLTQAVVWYRKAIENNNAPAMYHLGLILEAKNGAEAAQLFQRAANAGYAPAKAKAGGAGGLTVTGIDKGGVAENKSQLYRLSGSGFSVGSMVSSEAFSSIGSRDGQYDHRPTAVAPDGSWLAIYMSLPPQKGRTTVKIMVKNAAGGSATLDVAVQK